MAALTGAALRLSGGMFKAVASQGGKLMHSNKESIRKKGSAMMRANKSGGVLKAKVEKAIMATNVDTEKIMQNTKKLLVMFAKHSPALKQQLIVFNKSMSLMLRPIGDTMAKFLRPMAIWFMKFAQAWFKIFGVKTSPSTDSKEGTANQEAIIDQFGDESTLKADTKELAATEAKTTADAEPKNIFDASLFKEAETLTSQTVKDWNAGVELMKKETAILWKEIIPETFVKLVESFKNIFKSLADLFSEFSFILQPIWDLFAQIVGSSIAVVIAALGIAFETIAVTLQLFTLGIKFLKEGIDIAILAAEAIGAWFEEKLSKKFEAMKEKISAVWTSIVDGAKSLGSKIKEVFTSIVNKVIDKYNSIPFLPNIGKVESAATGKDITKTGIYELHAGETVVNSGETERNKSAGVNVTNYITVNASISNDMDIQHLADRLAELNETELRRRTSY